jgi:hypothetical protein
LGVGGHLRLFLRIAGERAAPANGGAQGVLPRSSHSRQLVRRSLGGGGRKIRLPAPAWTSRERCPTFGLHVRLGSSSGPVKRTLLSPHRSGTITQSGRLAQLGERRVRNAEVASSILAPSTSLRSRSRRRLPTVAQSAEVGPVLRRHFPRCAFAPLKLPAVQCGQSVALTSQPLTRKLQATNPRSRWRETSRHYRPRVTTAVLWPRDCQ